MPGYALQMFGNSHPAGAKSKPVFSVSQMRTFRLIRGGQFLNDSPLSPESILPEKRLYPLRSVLPTTPWVDSYSRGMARPLEWRREGVLGDRKVVENGPEESLYSRSGARAK